MAYNSSWDGHMMISTQIIIIYFILTTVTNIVAVPLIDWILRWADKVQSFDVEAFSAQHETLDAPGPIPKPKLARRIIWSVVWCTVFALLFVIGMHRYY